MLLSPANRGFKQVHPGARLNYFVAVLLWLLGGQSCCRLAEVVFRPVGLEFVLEEGLLERGGGEGDSLVGPVCVALLFLFLLLNHSLKFLDSLAHLPVLPEQLLVLFLQSLSQSPLLPQLCGRLRLDLQGALTDAVVDLAQETLGLLESEDSSAHFVVKVVLQLDLNLVVHAFQVLLDHVFQVLYLRRVAVQVQLLEQVHHQSQHPSFPRKVRQLLAVQVLRLEKRPAKKVQQVLTYLRLMLPQFRVFVRKGFDELPLFDLLPLPEVLAQELPCLLMHPGSLALPPGRALCGVHGDSRAGSGDGPGGTGFGVVVGVVAGGGPAYGGELGLGFGFHNGKQCQQQASFMTDKQSKVGRLWDYKIVSVIGRGATAVVYKVRHIRSRHLFALKKVNIANLSEGQKVQMYREVRFLSKVDDRRIVRLFQSFISNNHLYMVLELVEGGDLSRLIALKKEKSSFWLEGELLGMYLELLQIVSFLHQRNIMHRDIKVENILLDLQQNFKLADLGLARHISSDHEQERVGTPAYFAPQLLLHRNYNQKIDIWAMGCVFYNLAALRHPFQGLTLNTLPNYVLESDPPPLKNYSPRVSQVVFSMLSKEMDDRPSAQQLIDFISQSPESRPPNRLRIFNMQCLKQLKLSEVEREPLQSDELSPTRIVPSLGQIVDMIDSQCRRASQRVQLSPIKKEKNRYENYLHPRKKKESLGLSEMRTSSVPKSSGFDLKELRRELSLGRDD